MPSPNGADTPTESCPPGLDRGAFNIYEQAERRTVAKLQASGFGEQVESSDDHDNASSHTHVAHDLGTLPNKIRAKARTKTKELIQLTRKNHTSPSPPAAPCLAPRPSDSMDDDRLYNPLPEPEGPSAKDLIHHPISTVQSRLHGASGAKFAQVVDNQVIAHGANVGLVRAWDKLGSAQNEEERNHAMDEVEDLKKERQDSYVRWTMDRHVLKVRQKPPRILERPRRKDYVKADKEGRIKLQWADYGRHLVRFYAEQHCDHHIEEPFQLPSANEDAINTSIERLLMTSMAYQTALMNVRHIYRWDDPNKTAVYCSAYFLLLMVGHLGSGMISFMLLLVLKRWYYPPTPESLNEDIKRSEDTQQTALNLTQLIEQHGSRGWLDALIEKMGPGAMLQLEDMADALEILRNFYEWRDPPRTAKALGVLAACLLAFTVCPLWLLVRGAQFSFGVMFFGVFPISSHCPQYRHLVSPFKWAFWKISTDAEWAIARVQAEAHQTIEAIRSGRVGDKDSKSIASSTRIDEDDVEQIELQIGRMHCTTKDRQGRLHHGHICITSRGAMFETAVRSRTLWTLRWNDVSAISKAGTDDGLRFEVGDETRYSIDALKGRDEIFTQVIGYSGLSWQVSD